MTNALSTAVTAAIKALPKGHKARKGLEAAMQTRADYAARGEKAWKSRRKAKKAKKVTRH